jgi:hypothetical protein
MKNYETFIFILSICFILSLNLNVAKQSIVLHKHHSKRSLSASTDISVKHLSINEQHVFIKLFEVWNGGRLKRINIL